MAVAADRKPRERTTLALQGMTCSACATRIERKLNKLDGVDAAVNFATETAAVSFDSTQVALADLVRAVEAAGYGAAPAADASAEDATRAQTLRLIVALALTVPVVLLAMIPLLQFADWQWLALALATPVVF